MRNLDTYPNRYNKQPFESFQIFFRKKKIKEILTNNEHRVLLEIGCGMESIFNDIDTFKKLYITEPAELFYKKAILDLKKHKQKNIVVINKLIEECTGELRPVHFDFILLSSLLHEVSDPKLFLNTIYNITNAKTIVHINVPNAKSFHRLLAVEMGLIKDETQKSESNIELQQHTVFDMNGLTTLVEDMGFCVLDSGSYLIKPFTHLQMENMIQTGQISQEMLDGLYKMEKYMPGLGSEIYINVRRK